MIVLRHSDSCTEDASLKDHDRPLTAWGRSAGGGAVRARGGRGLGGPRPGAVQRLDAVARDLGGDAGGARAAADATTVFMGSLYAVAAMDGVTADHLKETIVEWAEKAENEKTDEGGAARAVRCVLLVGHNKGWEEAASDFTGERVSLRVANAALIECASDDDDGSLTWARAFDSSGPAGWTLSGVETHGLPDPDPASERGRATGARRGRGTTGPGTRLGEKVRPSPRRALLFSGTREKSDALCISVRRATTLTRRRRPHAWLVRARKQRRRRGRRRSAASPELVLVP